MRATLERRLERLEARRRAQLDARWLQGIAQLRATMDPEHVTAVVAWLRANVDGKRFGPCILSDWHVCPRCIDRLNPPALARAVWLLLLAHVTDGVPISMPPNVAEVYLNDPDAYPARSCLGCGYLLPMRSKHRPDGTYRHIASYEGICPVCERDSHNDYRNSVEGAAS